MSVTAEGQPLLGRGPSPSRPLLLSRGLEEGDAERAEIPTWDIVEIAADAAQLESRLNDGWEPYGLSADGRHFLRRRRPGVPGALILPLFENQVSLRVYRAVFPGWTLLRPLADCTGRKWPRIVSLWRPTRREGWVWVALLKGCFTDQQGRIEFLVPP